MVLPCIKGYKKYPYFVIRMETCTNLVKAVAQDVLGSVLIINAGSARAENSIRLRKKRSVYWTYKQVFFGRPGGFYAAPCGFA